jgi:hypothetical protein
VRQLFAACLSLLALNAHAVDLAFLLGYRVSAEFENVKTNTAVQLDETANYAVALDFPCV